METFSDSVIAVAITLLVLNIAVPKPRADHTLADELLSQWPVYAAYVTSFATIGIMWINHHAVIGRLDRVDHVILMLNLLLLMCIGLVPFATSLIATYLKQGQGQTLAAGVYAGTFLVVTIVFVTLNWHILFRKAHLLDVELAHERRRRILSRGLTGVVPYAIATAVAPLSPYATLIICGAIALYYALPLATGGSPG
jgi:TMEM175 potassium channel family protein